MTYSERSIVCWESLCSSPTEVSMANVPTDSIGSGSVQYSTQKGAPEKRAPQGPQKDEPRLVLALVSQRPVDGECISLARVDELLIGGARAESFDHEDRRIKIKIVDSEISGRHATVRRVVGGWELEDVGSTNGTRVNGDFVRAPTTLLDGDLIEIGRSVLVFRSVGSGAAATLGRTFGNREVETGPEPIFSTWVRDLERDLIDLHAVASSRVPVLVRGETGTGKEVVAQAVHKLSGRGGRFVPINCAALPETLIESQLFGYVKGAFSGADRDKIGLIRSAEGGTLFLDEIGDLPMTAQGALLRVLQEHKVWAVGASQPVPVDVRVMAATNRDLDKMIEQDRFRRDLIARLGGFELTLPTLLQRREDIGILMAAILRRLPGDALNVTFSREAARALLLYPYPGNVRQLEKALETAVVIADGKQVELEHLPKAIRFYRPPQLTRPGPADKDLLGELVKNLREEHGNLSAVARRMGKAHQQIRRWCKRFRINVDEYRKPTL
jgi:sigma-54 dependent transcriptional regulator, acetoin dehydrogenase operon transcriptional activator AcoR